MGIAWQPESAHSKELAKWESVPTPQCPTPLKPYEYREYPAMFYKASRPTMGAGYEFEQRPVEDETQAGNMRSRGWGQGQAEAVDLLMAREKALGIAAAERAYSEQGMSEKARAEANAYDASVEEHVGEIPETPIKRRVRRTKAQIAAAKGH